MRKTSAPLLLLSMLLTLQGVALAQSPDAAPADPPPDAQPAQAPGDVSTTKLPVAAATGEVERPKLLIDSPPRYPKSAWDKQIEADVVLLLTLDDQGTVTDVELVTAAGNGFDEEALAAARKLKFSPARVGGVPTPVKIRYTFRFRRPEKETVAREPIAECKAGCRASCGSSARSLSAGCPTDPRKKATLKMTVIQRGKGKPMAGIEIYLLDHDRVYLTDKNGKLELSLEPGAYAITIRPPSFYVYEAIERLKEGESLEVKYFVRKHRRARYKTLVWGTEGRSEVARTSLVDDEIRSIPGTMGDPIRVTMLLPGVTGSISGLGYPIVRGALPGDSLYEIDGIQVPMLYHLLFGNAVTHPRFTDEITFQPGGFAASSGRFPGGRISATSARVEDNIWVADLSIVSTSLYHARKIGDNIEVVAAARYGTLGYIIEGIASNAVLRYWDYQTRVSYRLPNGGLLKLTVIGVGDAAGDKDEFTGQESVVKVGFHRADLRYRQAIGKGWLQTGVQLGLESFIPPEDNSGGGGDPDDLDLDSRETMVRPYVEAGYTVSKAFELKMGGDLLVQNFGLTLPGGSSIFVSNPSMGMTFGVWASGELTLGKFNVLPSIRIDHYRFGNNDGDPRATSVDPRISASYQFTMGLIAKASVGMFHGPPRFSFVEPPIVFGPIPAFNGLGLEHGLNSSMQYQAGVEVDLPGDLQATVTGYTHDNHYAIDFSLIGRDLLPSGCNGGGGGFQAPVDLEGRSTGAELLLRRRLGKSVFGWLSYGYSSTERTVDGVGSFPFDFDQTHVLNLVLSWDVGRNWTVGGVFHYNTGRPYTPEIYCGASSPVEFANADINSARLPSFWRLDLRIQKREVFETWYFDFYIDFFNASFQWETIGFEFDYSTGRFEPVTFPLFLPIIGIRGQF